MLLFPRFAVDFFKDLLVLLWLEDTVGALDYKEVQDTLEAFSVLQLLAFPFIRHIYQHFSFHFGLLKLVCMPRIYGGQLVSRLLQTAQEQVRAVAAATGLVGAPEEGFVLDAWGNKAQLEELFFLSELPA